MEYSKRTETGAEPYQNKDGASSGEHLKHHFSKGIAIFNLNILKKVRWFSSCHVTLKLTDKRKRKVLNKIADLVCRGISGLIFDKIRIFTIVRISFLLKEGLECNHLMVENENLGQSSISTRNFRVSGWYLDFYSSKISTKIVLKLILLSPCRQAKCSIQMEIGLLISTHKQFQIKQPKFN